MTKCGQLAARLTLFVFVYNTEFIDGLIERNQYNLAIAI